MFVDAESRAFAPGNDVADALWSIDAGGSKAGGKGRLGLRLGAPSLVDGRSSDLELTLLASLLLGLWVGLAALALLPLWSLCGTSEAGLDVAVVCMLLSGGSAIRRSAAEGEGEDEVIILTGVKTVFVLLVPSSGD